METGKSWTGKRRSNHRAAEFTPGVKLTTSPWDIRHADEPPPTARWWSSFRKDRMRKTTGEKEVVGILCESLAVYHLHYQGVPRPPQPGDLVTQTGGAQNAWSENKVLSSLK
ncbi:hypothetical protein ATANTOWER_017327 [Ataeniobius toweri]|uniref:Uncharacterized protein n=1 Tax=Ataeniobius toweri TaxID=208326 RepID=A0ABU7AAI3_9TELE|nr:hypothetical protein [Ataeniobius toweri]